MIKRFALPLVFCLCIPLLSYAQYCSPTANCVDGDYINNVSFNTISNLNSGGSNCGYGSYTNTGMSTNVSQGQTYTLMVQSDSTWQEGIGVWIDYNHNGSFNDPGEFVYATPSAATTPFTTNITIPVTSMTGPTRMRVRCTFGQVVTASESCTAFTYGETEDYTVNIMPDTMPPSVAFDVNGTYTCNGTIAFYDQSTNNPTSWHWDFGDGATDTVQNPVHTYTSGGTYTITLIASNAYGSDTLVKPNYITVNASVPTPIAASCTPTTQNYCCGFGIINVTFNTINNNSGDASNGYEDFTCDQTTVTAGHTYTISVTNGQGQNNIRAWIDYNNDGVLDNSTELVFSADQDSMASGTVTIPTNAVTNQPLRLRVSSDYYLNAVPTPCSNLQQGQAEDYTVVVQPNTSPPVAGFYSGDSISCSGTVSFTDSSQNAPTSWYWNFGDGGTSFSQNPTHNYSSNGTYSVTLIVSNAYGTDTIVKPNYITVNTNAQLVPASCTPITTSYCCNYGIYTVMLNTINNNTDGGADNYQDYSCTNYTTLKEGTNYNIEVRTGPDNPEDVRVWIDYNNDGAFTSNELVYSSNNAKLHTGMIQIPSGVAVLNTPLRMRVMSDYTGSTLSPCHNVQWGQVEDYGVTVIPNPIPPSADFMADSTSSCSGTVAFTDLSSNASSWLWSFGDGTTDTIQNPVHQYMNNGTYTVKLVVTNSYGSDSLIKTNYVVVDSSLCDFIAMPQTGNGPTQTACTGTIYDSGGPYNNYQNNTSGTMTIAPTGAQKVTLTFNSFYFEQGFDYLYVYDGPSTASPLIGQFTGSTLPNGGTITSSGNAITLYQYSDNITNEAGFKATWQCVTGISENQLKNQLIIYPNPTRDILNIDFDASGLHDFNISIVNVLGQAVFHDHLSEMNRYEKQLDLHSYPSGVYFVKINSAAGSIVRKIILQ